MPAPGKPFPAERVTARQDLVKSSAVDTALEAELAGEASGPTAGSFSVTEVVVLRALRYRVEVVVGLAVTQGPHAQHVAPSGSTAGALENASLWNFRELRCGDA